MTATKAICCADVREMIRSGCETLACAVKVTLGSRGPMVVPDREVDAPQIVSSGVVVATAIEPKERRLRGNEPAKVTPLALQNAGSIASLLLTVDCLIGDSPKTERVPEGALAELCG